MDADRCLSYLDRWICFGGAVLILVGLLLCTNLTHGGPSDVAGRPSLKATVVVSRNIRPYLEALEGFKSGLSRDPGADIEVIAIADLGTQEKANLAKRLSGERLDLLVGIGPEAGLFIWNDIPGNGLIKLYLMVLNPEKVFGSGEGPCGVFLNIPIPTQIQMIRKGIPSIQRVGLLYDPQINSDFFREAAKFGLSSGVAIVPLSVTSKKDIPSVLEKRWGDVDALWFIPDRTVVSESIVHHVIKEAFIRKLPVIGFNRFFYEAGAALAFVFDYEALGKECAQLAVRAAAGHPCRSLPPVFEVWVNPLVSEKLGLKVPANDDPSIRRGP